jgi:NAD(P)-dependent dehydrogenase (short-subunit alcohol dehydrogenase family)
MARNLVIVTGGSSGIGLALVETCPLPEAKRIDVSRRGAAGCEHLAADLSDPGSWADVAALFDREIGGFDGDRVVFFHSAGTLTPIGFAGEVDAAAYVRNVLLNSAAPQVLGDAFLRAASATQTRCDLVMIGSGAASSVYEGWSSYGAGKAAVNQWVAVAGAEQQRRGGRCRVLSVAPGVVATAMQEEIRATPERDFPDVQRFNALHDDAQLRDARQVALDLWGLIDRPDLANGAVLDLRS